MRGGLSGQAGCAFMENDLSDLQAKLRSMAGSNRVPAQDKRSVWAEQVSGVVDFLGGQGISAEELAPLCELQDALRNDLDEDPYADDDEDPEEFMEARTGNVAPSDAILARSCAVLDLLVLEGRAEDQAAQVVTRKLLLAGVNPPSGGDARGYMRLVEWRQKLRQGRVPAGALKEYERFRATIEDIPLRDRLNRVLTERLWDRRAER